MIVNQSKALQSIQGFEDPFPGRVHFKGGKVEFTSSVRLCFTCPVFSIDLEWLMGTHLVLLPFMKP